MRRQGWFRLRPITSISLHEHRYILVEQKIAALIAHSFDEAYDEDYDEDDVVIAHLRLRRRMYREDDATNLRYSRMDAWKTKKREGTK